MTSPPRSEVPLLTCWPALVVAQVALQPARWACQSASKSVCVAAHPQVRWVAAVLRLGLKVCLLVPTATVCPRLVPFVVMCRSRRRPSCHSHEPWAGILPCPTLSQLPRSSPSVGSRRLEKRFVSVRSARSKVEVLQAPGLPHGCSSANVTVTTMAGHTYRVP